MMRTFGATALRLLHGMTFEVDKSFKQFLGLLQRQVCPRKGAVVVGILEPPRRMATAMKWPRGRYRLLAAGDIRSRSPLLGRQPLTCGSRSVLRNSPASSLVRSCLFPALPAPAPSSPRSKAVRGE